MKQFLIQFKFLVILPLLFTGCDFGTYASRVDAPKKASDLELVDRSAVKEKEPNNEFADSPAVGSWSFNSDGSRQAGIEAWREQELTDTLPFGEFSRSLDAAIMVVNIEPDGTYTCEQAVSLTSAGSFRGTWELKGNNLKLKQTHKGSSRDKREWEGTVNGDTMEIVESMTMLMGKPAKKTIYLTHVLDRN